MYAGFYNYILFIFLPNGIEVPLYKAVCIGICINSTEKQNAAIRRRFICSDLFSFLFFFFRGVIDRIVFFPDDQSVRDIRKRAHKLTLQALKLAFCEIT